MIYDLLRSGSADGFDVASCLESGDGDTAAADFNRARFAQALRAEKA